VEEDAEVGGAEIAGDDDLGDLPELDGELADDDVAGTVEVEDGGAGGVDETVGLDDEIAAEEAAEAMIEPLADLESEGWETGEEEPVEADDELAEGEVGSWTEGSEHDEDAPIELDEELAPEEAGDPGEEGLEDDGRGEELELPPAPPADEREEYPDDLELGLELPPRRAGAPARAPER
jgi:hypothetical protein